MTAHLYLYCLSCGRHFTLFEYGDDSAVPGRIPFGGPRRHYDGTPNLTEMTGSLLEVERLERFIGTHTQGACPADEDAGRAGRFNPYQVALAHSLPPMTEYNFPQRNPSGGADKYDERYRIRKVEQHR